MSPKDAQWAEVEPGLYRRTDVGDREKRRRMIEKIIGKSDSPLLKELMRETLAKEK